jgi:phage regulator Rha-like protein
VNGGVSVKELITVRSNEAFTNSMVVANGTGNTHHSVQQMIRKHSSTLERWGKIEFRNLKCRNPKGGRPAKVFFLNEQQAIFLVTLLDNNEIVVQFKAELVDEFCKMRKVLTEKQTSSWLESRKAGKLTRRTETDVIKDLIVYAKAQGSKHADMLYQTYSKLANKMAGISKRDLANIKQLNVLDEVESMILHVIKLGMIQGKHYKEIYKDCKRRLEWWQDCTFRLT